MSRQILFVDDEPMVLRGIERSLRTMRQQWQMEFAEGGAQALEMMGRGDFDVVITDMRMPGMDGAQFLREVKSRFPETARMVLSGHSDETTVFRALQTTHQYLSKPCDAEEIKSKLTRMLKLRDMLDNPGMKQTVSRLETIPSRPSAYAAVHRVLQSPDAEIGEAGRWIADDMGMTAKILQLANSAFLGPARTTANTRQALSQLGLKHLTTLAMTADVFSDFGETPDSEMEYTWNESSSIAALSSELARREGCDEFAVDCAYAAGLLHDVGKLVLATECKQEYQQVMRDACRHEISLVEEEEETFGCSHAQVGGYLLGLWGLPDSVVEAVAWHHEPAKGHPSGFSPLIAVHVAHGQLGVKGGEREPDLIDEQLLERVGLGDRLPAWTATLRETLLSGRPRS